MATRGRPRTHKTRKGNGQGTIYQRADGLWTGQIVIGLDPATGKNIRKSVYGHTSEEADAKLSVLKAKMGAGINVNIESVIFEEWSARWLEVYKRPSVAIRTYEFYEFIVNTYLDTQFGKYKLKKITPILCQHCMNNLAALELSTKTYRDIRMTLRQIMDQALENGYVVANPAAKTKLPEGKESEIREALTMEEQKKFWAIIKGSRFEASVALLLYAGLRPGEMLALSWGDIDFKKRNIKISKAVSETKQKAYLKSTKTKGSKRKVPIMGGLYDILERNKKTAASLLIYPAADGDYLSSRYFREALYKFLDSKKVVHVEPYTLRHTFATRMYEAGVPMKTIQKWMGHKSITTTANTYVDVTDDVMKSAATQLDEYLAKSEMI